MSAYKSQTRVHWETMEEKMIKQGTSAKTIRAFKAMFFTGALLSGPERANISAIEDPKEAEAARTAMIEDIADALAEVEIEANQEMREKAAKDESGG